MSQAETAKIRADQDAQERRRASSQAQLAEEETRLRIQRSARVSRLLDQANTEFQMNNFDSAVLLLDRALHEDPNNVHAADLRDLASRARHDARTDLLRQDWKAEWSKSFDELARMDVPQTEVIKFDMARWAEVSKRKPIKFTTPEELDSPEERAIREKLV
ncbi:hypothetical protein, partial [Streptococcus pseudopneumoniae]|uniref:hypothetical protein n=1 Tax=Streptococcus pseudopneumoniae TaxID=257758 RepID=UPI001485E4E4